MFQCVGRVYEYRDTHILNLVQSYDSQSGPSTTIGKRLAAIKVCVSSRDRYVPLKDT